MGEITSVDKTDIWIKFAFIHIVYIFVLYHFVFVLHIDYIIKV